MVCEVIGHISYFTSSLHIPVSSHFSLYKEGGGGEGEASGADPGGVDWVSSHPPKSLNVDKLSNNFF